MVEACRVQREGLQVHRMSRLTSEVREAARMSRLTGEVREAAKPDPRVKDPMERSKIGRILLRALKEIA